MPARWRKLLGLIPGYDPFATARPGDRFDATEADFRVGFFADCLTHVEGALAGAPFRLEPWQQAIVGCLFGWKAADGYRRYREMFLYIPRKNGKTPLAAGIANSVLFCDNEVGAQNLCAAADREQASLLYRQAKGQVENEPALARRAKIYQSIMQRSIWYPEQNSGFKVVSSDATTKHGMNGHFGAIDELHALPNRELADVIQTSMASANRRQPLLICLTTADYLRESICNEKYEYAVKVRDGLIADPQFLPVIYEATDAAAWDNERTWEHANPNLDVSVSREYLRRECARAKASPGYENTFKRLHLNLRTEQDVRWLAVELWDQAAGLRSGETAEIWRERRLRELAGQPHFAGLDLSAKIDLTAYVEIYPPHGDRTAWVLLPWYWVPQAQADAMEAKGDPTYAAWSRHGWLTLTPGSEVDQPQIRAFINQRAAVGGLQEIGYDPWNAVELSRQMREEDGLHLVEVRQGSMSLSDPMKELEAMVLARRIEHGANPVLRANVANVAVKIDENGNVRPVKNRSTGKIDGLVAAVTGMARALASPQARPSVYEFPDTFAAPAARRSIYEDRT